MTIDSLAGLSFFERKMVLAKSMGTIAIKHDTRIAETVNAHNHPIVRMYEILGLVVNSEKRVPIIKEYLRALPGTDEITDVVLAHDQGSPLFWQLFHIEDVYTLGGAPTETVEQAYKKEVIKKAQQLKVPIVDWAVFYAIHLTGKVEVAEMIANSCVKYGKSKNLTKVGEVFREAVKPWNAKAVEDLKKTFDGFYGHDLEEHVLWACKSLVEYSNSSSISKVSELFESKPEAVESICFAVTYTGFYVREKNTMLNVVRALYKQRDNPDLASFGYSIANSARNTRSPQIVSRLANKIKD